MIEKMHERSNGPLFKIIFALVSISFVLGGLGTSFIGGNHYAAKVNGDEISQHSFNNAKTRQQQQLNAQLGERFWDLLDNPQYAEQFNQSVLNSLIDRQLLLQYTKDLNLAVSADQIKSQIVHDPNFQQEGKFNNALYQQVLRNNGISADYYASLVGEGMVVSQINEGIVRTEFNVPAQQALLAKLLLQQRTVRLATYPINSVLAAQTASEEELQSYYDAHKNAFIEPEKISVEYISISPDDVKSKVEITDEQIQTYYDRNQAQYVSQAENRLAHIQLSDEQSAQEVLQAIQNGEDFAKLAQEKSKDTLSAKQGGYLGWAKSGTFPAEFEQAAANLAVNGTSSVVKVGADFHIIKLLDRKDGNAIPLEQVKSQIAEIIRQDLIATEYSNTARLMANDAFENNSSLEVAAKTGNVTVKTTAPFERHSIPDDLNHDKIIKALFNSDLRQTQQNSEAIDISEGNNVRTVFVRISQHQEERIKSLDEAKSEVENALKREKAEFALLKQAQDNINLLNEGKQAEVNFGAVQSLTYAQAINETPHLTETIFAMPKPTNASQYSIARNENNDIVIVALDKVEDGSLEAFKEIAPHFAQADQVVLEATMMNDLRQRASIEINDDFIKQSRSH